MISIAVEGHAMHRDDRTQDLVSIEKRRGPRTEP